MAEVVGDTDLTVCVDRHDCLYYCEFQRPELDPSQRIIIRTYSDIIIILCTKNTFLPNQEFM